MKLNEKSVVSTIIREEIEILDAKAEREKAKRADELDSSPLTITNSRQITGTYHVSLSSSLKSCTIQFLENQFNQDSAFKDFRKRLSKALTSIFNKENRIRLGAHDEVLMILKIMHNSNIIFQIFPYQTLCVSYESTVSWCQMTDILRAHPKFHNRPRYDHILVDAGNGEHFIAQLLYIFGIFVEHKTHYFALILPFNVPISCIQQSPIDRHFQFTRVRARRRSASAFIGVNSIVRGVVLTPAHDVEYGDEFLLFDQLDEDMWMRKKSMTLAVSLKF